MNANEQLAVLTSIKKMVDDRIKVVRAEVDKEFYQQADVLGVEKVGLKVNGEKVGDLILTYHKEGFNVTDRDAFEDFALTYGLATIKSSIRPEMVGAVIKVIEGAIEPEHVRDFVKEEVVLAGDWEEKLTRAGDAVFLADSGLVVPGVSYRPKAVKGTQVRGCSPEQVTPILQAMPGGITALLLGGGE